MTQARQAAYAALDASAIRGARPVLLVPSYLSVLQERRELAQAGKGFGVAVDTLRSWPEDLWSLHGDGSAPVDANTRLMMLWNLVRESASLTPTPGKARLLAECAATAMPYIAPSPDLSLNESAAVEILSAYRDQLAQRNLIEPSEILVRLQDSPALDVYDVVVLGIDDDTLSFAQRSFLEARNAVFVSDEAERPCDAPREPELAQLLQTIFHRSAQTPPIEPTGCVRWALSAGPSASTSLIADAVSDLARDFPESPIVVTARDPHALFEQIAPRLHRIGLTTSLQGRILFEETDVGRILSILADLLSAEMPDIPEACDYSFNPLSGASHASAFRTSELLRRDRLTTSNDALSDLASNGGDALMGMINRIEEGSFDTAFDLLQAYIDARFAQQPAYRSTQSRALEAARAALEAAAAQNVPFCQAVPLLQGSTIKLSYGESDSAAVQIMSLQDASELPPSYTRSIVLCDLNAADYPVSAEADALQTLLGKMNVAAQPDPLKRARMQLFRALQCASDRIVMQRSLHDEDADNAAPAVLFTEVIDCYRASLTGTDDFDPVLAVPKALVPFSSQAGEQDIMRNVSGFDALPVKQQAEIPPLGKIGSDMREFIILPQAINNQYVEGTMLSPSQIESYLECPYQWFAKRRLKLQSIDEGFTSVERGSFVHDVLEGFYRQFLREGFGKVSAGNRDAASRVLAQAFGEQVERHDTDCNPGRRYAAVTEWERQQRAELLPALDSYLDLEATLLPSFNPTYFEWEYGRTAPYTYAGCYINGRVDRIDVDGLGHAVVIDYKTSISSDYRLHGKEDEVFQLPRKMQALIYSKAIRDLLGLQVVGALYVNPLGNEVRGAWDSSVVGPADIPFDSPIEATCGRIPYVDIRDFNDLLARSEEAVEAKLDQLKDGMIEPEPLSSKVCDYCPVLFCSHRPAKGA